MQRAGSAREAAARQPQQAVRSLCCIERFQIQAVSTGSAEMMMMLVLDPKLARVCCMPGRMAFESRRLRAALVESDISARRWCSRCRCAASGRRRVLEWHVVR